MVLASEHNIEKLLIIPARQGATSGANEQAFAR
jgi:hypothetical protein